MRITLEGVDDLKKALDGKLAEYKTVLERAVEEAADAVRDDARREVPVGDPPFHLRDAIGVRQEGLTADVGLFDRQAHYGVYVEFGTSNRQPKPFMQPAAELERNRFADRVREAIRDST